MRAAIAAQRRALSRPLSLFRALAPGLSAAGLRALLLQRWPLSNMAKTFGSAQANALNCRALTCMCSVCHAGRHHGIFCVKHSHDIEEHTALVSSHPTEVQNVVLPNNGIEGHEHINAAKTKAASAAVLHRYSKRSGETQYYLSIRYFQPSTLFVWSEERSHARAQRSCVPAGKFLRAKSCQLTYQHHCSWVGTGHLASQLPHPMLVASNKPQAQSKPVQEHSPPCSNYFPHAGSACSERKSQRRSAIAEQQESIVEALL